MLDGSANSDGPGFLVRGQEFAPVRRSELAQHPEGVALLVSDHIDPDATGDPVVRNNLDPHPVDRPSVDLDSFVVSALVRMARLAGSVADALRECPDAGVRRSAALLAARAYPVRAAFDE